MPETTDVRCEIYCQKGKFLNAAFSLKVQTSELSSLPVHTGGYEKDGVRVTITEQEINGCQIGEISVHIRNESCRENDNLRAESPVRVYLPTEELPEKITAMYLYNEWWTRPAFVNSLEDIPARTQVAFFQYKDRYACFVPMIGQAFKTYLIPGTKTEIGLEMTAWTGGQRSLEEPLYLLAEAPVLQDAIHKAFSWLAEYKGIRMRKDRRIPEMFRYLGWCSWDAFYKEVSEKGIRDKAAELTEKKVPVAWMLIDDGWLSARDELLSDFIPDKGKFPEGFRKMTDDIREQNNIRWFGVWHALGGYWGGVAPESDLALIERSHLYSTVNGKLVPSPYTGDKFYHDWYRELNREGISFVKVDGQSAVPYYFENSLPVCEAAAGMNQALESGASLMDGAVVNCMGMAMENILARPVSAVSRNSDDFVPDKEGGFTEHLLQNAYNSLYHNELYCCDWDMFWTSHPDAGKHSLLRAVSGGPVYVSDKVGDTDPEILKPLIYHNGELLMMDRSARPTDDCVFANPLTDGVLKLHNVASYGGSRKGGGFAVYNLTGQTQTFSFSPKEIPDLETADVYCLYDYFGKKATFLEREKTYDGSLEKNGCGWFVLLPCGKNGAFLGLLDKYAGFMAVESIWESENTSVAILRESGPLGWCSAKKPSRISLNSEDVTDQVIEQNGVFLLSLPEKAGKAVLCIEY